MNRADRRALSRDIAKQIAAGGVDLAAPPQQPAPPQVLTVGYVRGPFVAGEWAESLLSFAVRSGSVGLALRPKFFASGPDLAKARNEILRFFVDDVDDPYLLFVDTDIVFTVEDVQLLLEADAAIAGAFYLTAAPGVEPHPAALVEYDQHEAAEPGEQPGPMLYVPWTAPEVPEELLPDEPSDEAIAALIAWKEEALKPVAVATPGLGLTLIRRDAAEAVAKTYRYPFEFVDGRSEDLTFSLRAADEGFESLLVPQARVGHLKAVVL